MSNFEGVKIYSILPKFDILLPKRRYIYIRYTYIYIYKNSIFKINASYHCFSPLLQVISKYIKLTENTLYPCTFCILVIKSGV